jgi:hypothetical protein
VCTFPLSCCLVLVLNFAVVLADIVQCRNLLAREQQRIRSEYEERLRELERERQTVEEDKAQVCPLC